jgi:hypothetical protein
LNEERELAVADRLGSKINVKKAVLFVYILLTKCHGTQNIN